MNPTNELRFVEREVAVERAAWEGHTLSEVRVQRILQQKVVNDDCKYEWRDVPVEKEQP